MGEWVVPAGLALIALDLDVLRIHRLTLSPPLYMWGAPCALPSHPCRLHSSSLSLSDRQEQREHRRREGEGEREKERLIPHSRHSSPTNLMAGGAIVLPMDPWGPFDVALETL